MKKSLIINFLIFILCIVSCFSCEGQIYSKDLRGSIRRLMSENAALGVSVAVVKDNKLCYHESFGYNPDYQDPDRSVSINDDDVFRIASISKTFVATAIMQLVEKGLVRLDEDINSYLYSHIRNPYYPDIPITVKMLLNHRSSLTDFQYGKYRYRIDMLLNRNVQDKKDFFLNRKPGAYYNYSNYGYSLLGAIIENITQVRFDMYIENNILLPLGIKGGYNVSKIDSTKFVWARTYNKKSKTFSNSPQMYKSIAKELDKYVLGESTGLFSPAGGMILSVPDLAKYMLMHMNYGSYNGVSILKKESEEQLWKVNSNRYGLGFMHANFKLKGVDLIGHQGGAYGIHSTMFFNPEEKYGFIVICNGCNSGHNLDTQILRELYHYFIR